MKTNILLVSFYIGGNIIGCKGGISNLSEFNEMVGCIHYMKLR